MSERECKYYRCIKNKKEKYVQWWSFHELDFDEIMQEITLYIYLNRKDGLDFIILNGEERMFTEEIKGKKSNTILMQIEEYYKKNDFKNISIYFKNWNVFLCKGQPDSYWRSNPETIIKLPKKKKLRDLTEEEYKKWVIENCDNGILCCKDCVFRYANCDKHFRWIDRKDLYSDKFLDQEIEVEE